MWIPFFAKSAVISPQSKVPPPSSSSLANILSIIWLAAISACVSEYCYLAYYLALLANHNLKFFDWRSSLPLELIFLIFSGEIIPGLTIDFKVLWNSLVRDGNWTVELKLEIGWELANDSLFFMAGLEKYIWFSILEKEVDRNYGVFFRLLWCGFRSLWKGNYVALM
jgi:hypothetical protein